jgi:YfiH family protein
MQHWTRLEDAGLRAAAMSDRGEGDCALSAANAAARGAFLVALGLEPARLVCPRQPHGVLVVRAREEDAGKGAAGPENAIAPADAIITDTPGLPIGITVADCVPVAIYDPVRRAIGLAHAGREGTVGQIAAHTVRAMHEAFGCEPADLLAVIGPSAGPERYEVSQELADRFVAAGGPVQGRCLDLWGANRLQLLGAGVPEEQIHVAGICTLSSDTFHSYRRHKTAARNLVVLCL